MVFLWQRGFLVLTFLFYILLYYCIVCVYGPLLPELNWTSEWTNELRVYCNGVDYSTIRKWHGADTVAATRSSSYVFCRVVYVVKLVDVQKLWDVREWEGRGNGGSLERSPENTKSIKTWRLGGKASLRELTALLQAGGARAVCPSAKNRKKASSFGPHNWGSLTYCWTTAHQSPATPLLVSGVKPGRGVT